MIWFLIMLSVVLVFAYFAGNARNPYFRILSTLISVCLSVVFVFMVVFIITENVCAERHLVGLRAEREALVYQVENNIYFGDSVGQFNSRVMINRHYHDSPWTNWFTGGYWYEIDPIELKEHA